MKTKKQLMWEKENQGGKAPLAWSIFDYTVWGDEPPSCIVLGITEGEAMEDDDVSDWIREEIRTICVVHDEYPEKCTDLVRDFWLDLEYLKTLGKITNEEFDNLKREEIFDFDQK